VLGLKFGEVYVGPSEAAEKSLCDEEKRTSAAEAALQTRDLRHG